MDKDKAMIPQGRKSRKVQKGTVMSNKMQNTVVVAVKRVFRHPKYEKVITRIKKYYAHHDNLPLKVGDEVVISETRPISKLKCWRVVPQVV